MPRFDQSGGKLKLDVGLEWPQDGNVVDRGEVASVTFFYILFISYSAIAQDVPAAGPAALDRYALSVEHQFLTVEDQKLYVSVPVHKGIDSAWAFSVRGHRTVLGPRLYFAESRSEIPEEFGTADIGVSWATEDIGGNKIGLSATYGQAGTRLFSGEHDPILSATLFIERKKVDHSWLYFLVYSNSRTSLNNIPLPGFAYQKNDKTYSLLLGMPFLFASWRPAPWSLSGSVSPFGASVEGGYRFWGPLMLFAGANWSPKAYQNLVKGSADRLIFDKREASVGVRAAFGPLNSFSVAYVTGFDRRFLLGDSVFDSDAESLDVEDSSGVQVKARASF